MKTEREQFLDDIICTAVEGGINYWGYVSHYTWSDDSETSVKVHDFMEEDSVPVLVNRESIENAIKKISKMDTPIEYLHPSIRTEIYKAYLDNDAGDIDAGLADIIVQVSMFGKVVYG